MLRRLDTRSRADAALRSVALLRAAAFAGYAVTRELDERRVQWAADDLVRNRPALSRRHPDPAEAFAAFMAGAAKP